MIGNEERKKLFRERMLQISKIDLDVKSNPAEVALRKAKMQGDQVARNPSIKLLEYLGSEDGGLGPVLVLNSEYFRKGVHDKYTSNLVKGLGKGEENKTKQCISQSLPTHLESQGIIVEEQKPKCSVDTPNTQNKQIIDDNKQAGVSSDKQEAIPLVVQELKESTVSDPEPKNKSIFNLPKPSSSGTLRTDNSIFAPKKSTGLFNISKPVETISSSSQLITPHENTTTALLNEQKLLVAEIQREDYAIFKKNDKQGGWAPKKSIFGTDINPPFQQEFLPASSQVTPKPLFAAETIGSKVPSLFSTTQSQPTQQQKKKVQPAKGLTIFSQPSNASASPLPIEPTNNIFAANMATKGVGSIFSQGASNDPHPTLFSGQSKPTSDFLQSIFNKNTPASNLFTGGLIPPANADEEQDEDDNGEPLQAQDDFDPSLSTGKYNYVQSEVKFKENATKLRIGSRDIIENVTVSINCFPDCNDRFIYVRMANKCIAFEGRILKGTTQAKGINNTTRNVSIKEVINLQQAPKIEMAYLKLQFKDEKIGQRLIAEINEQK